MSAVYATISSSLDGYVAGPDDGPKHPLGIGGERLHLWAFGGRAWRAAHGMTGGTTGPDDDAIARNLDRYGAIVMGRRMFDLGETPWGDDPPFHTPVYVVTHRAHEPIAKAGGTTFHFVTEGVERAVELARETAGEKDVQVSGGGDVVAQCLVAGLLDELEVHVAPIFLGGGARMFDRPELAGVELRPIETTGSDLVAHLRYRVVRES
jgi:dihydrofolate reductase